MARLLLTESDYITLWSFTSPESTHWYHKWACWKQGKYESLYFTLTIIVRIFQKCIDAIVDIKPKSQGEKNKSQFHRFCIWFMLGAGASAYIVLSEPDSVILADWRQNRLLECIKNQFINKWVHEGLEIIQSSEVNSSQPIATWWHKLNTVELNTVV